MTWNSDMSVAPRDGTPVQAKIPGNGSDNIIAWYDGFCDDEDNDCAAWGFVEDYGVPDSWTDGICWGTNAEGVPSVLPTHWRIPPPPEETPDG